MHVNTGAYISMVPDGGAIEPAALYPVMVSIAVAKQDCTLAVAKGNDKKVFFFKKGEPVGSLTNILSETLVSFLQFKKLVTPAQVKVCLAECGTQQDMAFGGALVSKGIIDPALLQEVMSELLEKRLVDALSWKEGQYRVGSIQKMSYAPVKLDRPFLKLIFKKLMESESEIPSDFVASEDVVPLLTSVGGFDIFSVGFSAKETAVLRQVNGVSTVREIAERSKSDVSYIIKFLSSLRIMNLVRFEEREERGIGQQWGEIPLEESGGDQETDKDISDVPAASQDRKTDSDSKAVIADNRQKENPAESHQPDAGNFRDIVLMIEQMETDIDSKNHFEVLGVDADASDADIKAAYFNLVKMIHPDRLPKGIPDDIRERCEDLFSRVSEAFSVLSDPDKRDEYVEELKLKEQGVDEQAAMNALQSEVEFQKAQVLIKKGDFAGAEEALRKAIALYDQEPEYFVELGWAVYRSGRKSGKDRMAEAVEIVKTGISNNPKLAQGYFYLGQMFKLAGDTKQARAFFESTLKVNPKHFEAERELRLMDRAAAKQQSKGGGLKGIFKRKG